VPLLQLEGISKKFGQVVVGEEITFQLEQGDSVGIVGPNGAGKTSLFAMISGDIRPDSGDIFFEDMNLAHMTLVREPEPASDAPTRCPPIRAHDGV